MQVPISYSAMPPTVSCKDEAFTSKFGDKLEVDASGQVTAPTASVGLRVYALC